MKKLAALTLIGFVTFVCATFFPADNVNWTMPDEVQAVANITVSGNPGALIVNFAIAGFEPSSELDATSTYDVSNDAGTMKIVGSLDSAMPSATLLLANLTAPTGASSAGWQTLSTSPIDLVTSIGILDESALSISYRFHAPVAAGIIASAQKTVTLTISAQ